MENEIEEPAVKYNYTPAEEYLEMERVSEIKHELHHGTVITMAGASLNHNRIVSNITGTIHPFLKGQTCSIYPGDLRTKVLTQNSFVYPDVIIICSEPELMDDHFDTLLNPSVIIEVLSPSTENYDRGFKLFCYMQIPSLKEYIMLSSTEKNIYTSSKQNDGSWKFEEIPGNSASLCINTIKHTISMDDIYNGVKF